MNITEKNTSVHKSQSLSQPHSWDPPYQSDESLDLAQSINESCILILLS